MTPTRLVRLLTIERERAEAAERAAGAARDAVGAAEADAREADRALDDACARAVEAVTSQDLAEASAHCGALCARAAAFHRTVALRRAELEARERAVVAARIAERRIEKLAEQGRQADARSAERAARILADELAARGSRGRPSQWKIRD